MKYTSQDLITMLRESNAIEGVYDQTSLSTAHVAWLYINKFKKITPEIIKKTHAILMQNQNIESKYKGKWRDVPVWIGGDRKAQPPLVIQREVEEWCERTNTVDKNFDPVTLHIEFENIHPFIDGNGRIGRILLNWHLVKNGCPLLIYTEADVKTYYRLFRSYRAKEFSQIAKWMEEWMEEKRKHEQSNNNTTSKS